MVLMCIGWEGTCGCLSHFHVCPCACGVVQDEERLIEERKRKRQRILEEHRKREAELKVRHPEQPVPSCINLMYKSSLFRFSFKWAFPLPSVRDYDGLNGPCFSMSLLFSLPSDPCNRLIACAGCDGGQDARTARGGGGAGAGQAAQGTTSGKQVKGRRLRYCLLGFFLE